MPEYTYDDATHTYRIDGVVVPSVTQVLKEAGLVDDRWYTPEACQRGRLVAVATELYDNDQLNWDAVPDDIHGYVQAWIRFREDGPFEIIAREEERYSPTMRYAGTPDVTARWGGRPTLIEIKTGSNAAWHGLQLAGQNGLFDLEYRRVVVLLKSDGKYWVTEYDDPSDWDAFRGALAVCHWKRNHK
jgi:hypothetical protein